MWPLPGDVTTHHPCGCTRCDAVVRDPPLDDASVADRSSSTDRGAGENSGLHSEPDVVTDDHRPGGIDALPSPDVEDRVPVIGTDLDTRGYHDITADRQADTFGRRQDAKAGGRDVLTDADRHVLS